MSLRSLGPQPTEVCPVSDSAGWCWLSVPRSRVCPGSGGWCGFVLDCLLPSLLPRAGAPAVVIERRTLTCWERLSWRHESSFGSRLVDKTDRQRPKPAPSAIRLSIALTAAPDAQSRSWPDDGFGAPGAAGLDADGPPAGRLGRASTGIGPEILQPDRPLGGMTAHVAPLVLMWSHA